MKHIFYFTVAAALVFCGCKKEVKTATGSIYGVVADKATSEPVKSAGVQLSPTGTKTITGSEGQYEFANLAAGDYTITVSKTGYADLVNYAIKVEADKTNKGDVQIEVLPPSLRVVNDSKQDISTLEFGTEEEDIMRLFNIFNDGQKNLEWEIIVPSTWISVSKSSGTLKPGAAQAVIMTIDRNKVQKGSTTVPIISDNGSKTLTIRVGNVGLSEDFTADATTIGAVAAEGVSGTITNTGGSNYKVRYMCGAWWMIQNADKPANGAINNGDYGWLYKWDIASWGICPSGWSLPSIEDFSALKTWLTIYNKWSEWNSGFALQNSEGSGGWWSSDMSFWSVPSGSTNGSPAAYYSYDSHSVRCVKK